MHISDVDVHVLNICSVSEDYFPFRHYVVSSRQVLEQEPNWLWAEENVTIGKDLWIMEVDS